jgi:hypothetical protein
MERSEKAILPLASYYFVTIVIPLANGSGDTGRAFLEHMAFVILAPPALVVVFALLRCAARWAQGDAANSVPLSAQRSP